MGGIGVLPGQPIASDLASILRTRRDQLMEFGDLTEIGEFVIIQPGDTMAAIDKATGWPILIDGIPTWEWVQQQPGPIFEMPFILSDSGAGHVLLVHDAEGIDPDLLDLCRSYANQPNGPTAEGPEGT